MSMILYVLSAFGVLSVIQTVISAVVVIVILVIVLRRS